MNPTPSTVLLSLKPRLPPELEKKSIGCKTGKGKPKRNGFQIVFKNPITKIWHERLLFVVSAVHFASYLAGMILI